MAKIHVVVGVDPSHVVPVGVGFVHPQVTSRLSACFFPWLDSVHVQWMAGWKGDFLPSRYCEVQASLCRPS